MTQRILSLLCLAAFFPFQASAENWTMQLELQGRRLEGTPLSWDKNQVFLLTRDGKVEQFAPSKAQNFSKTSSSFRSYAQSEMRRMLLEEFGSSFDVSGTGQFLVVHPIGERDQWAKRFENLYRSFIHYFTARGLRPHSPMFPLVAIVFHRKSDFFKYSASTGAKIGPGVLGYYSLKTNRILLYDQTAGSGKVTTWQHETIIHEAAHQSAFNTGIHSRFSPPPRWVVEGVGMMFEAPGVYDSVHYQQQAHRINHGRFKAFKKYAATRRRKDAIANMISSDRFFKTDPDGAYAEAWALTFYLAETQPREYFQYLAKTGSREAFTEYRSADRIQDFAAIFGSNFAMLDARLLRFIEQLKAE